MVRQVGSRIIRAVHFCNLKIRSRCDFDAFPYIVKNSNLCSAICKHCNKVLYDDDLGISLFSVID